MWQARRVLPLLGQKHLLLVTLLLFNSAAAEALPIFLHQVVPGYVAVRNFVGKMWYLSACACVLGPEEGVAGCRCICCLRPQVTRTPIPPPCLSSKKKTHIIIST